MSRHHYILNSKGKPCPEPNLMKWATWFEKADAERIVARTTVGEATVSTVFLGIDHSFGHGPPILWETMVFRKERGEECTRCAGNREQAEAMHEEMVESLKVSSL